MITVGTPAPDFVLNDQNGQPFQLSTARGKKQVLLLFLPAAFTPVCSTEVPATAALLEDFLARDTLPFIVDVDNAPANLAWCRAENAEKIRILSDFHPHGAVSQGYGALAADGMSDRATVLVGKDGRVKYAVTAGRYGKRSVPGLLEVAAAANGGAPISASTAAAGLMPKLDLPILFTKKTCRHCDAVKAFLNRSGLSQKIVVRDVAGDIDAMRRVLAIDPQGGVPILLWPDGSHIAGDRNITAALQKKYQVR